MYQRNQSQIRFLVLTYFSLKFFLRKCNFKQRFFFNYLFIDFSPNPSEDKDSTDNPTQPKKASSPHQVELYVCLCVLGTMLCRSSRSGLGYVPAPSYQLFVGEVAIHSPRDWTYMAIKKWSLLQRFQAVFPSLKTSFFQMTLHDANEEERSSSSDKFDGIALNLKEAVAVTPILTL
eukprot:m.95906 g.95906  ORF g.95906 m.95906 type:complete len:176 (+) comp36880_c0_seq8:1283-1810(+)